MTLEIILGTTVYEICLGVTIHTSGEIMQSHSKRLKCIFKIAFLRIPAHREHPFRAIVSSDSGRS